MGQFIGSLLNLGAGLLSSYVNSNSFEILNFLMGPDGLFTP